MDLKIVEKIPGAWLVRIKDAGHAVMVQYPEENEYPSSKFVKKFNVVLCAIVT